MKSACPIPSVSNLASNTEIQTLPSLGLTPPTGSTASNNTAQSKGGTDSDGDNDGTTAASGAIKNDMRQFMHSLFQAVKAAAPGNSSNQASGSSGQKLDFSAGLSALISQVGDGTAPKDLHDAFAKLTADLQSAAPATTAVDAASNAGSSQNVTLQELLTKLQQGLGYGNGSSLAPVGNIVSTTA